MSNSGYAPYGNRTYFQLQYSKEAVDKGNHFIYSDNPEMLSNLAPGSFAYLWGASVGTAYKDVEMYHHVTNGYGGKGALSYGLVVANTTTKAVTITYKSKKASLNFDSAGNRDAEARLVTANMLRDYFDEKTEKTKTVPANTYMMLDAADVQFVPNYGKSIFYRGRLKASVASGVYVRVFVADAVSTTSGLANRICAEAACVPGVKDGAFCGEIDYTQKTAEITVGTTYYYTIFRHDLVQGAHNPAEQTEFSNVLHKNQPGLTFLDGNFGVQYHLKLKSASGRKIWIVPNWDNTDRGDRATVLFRFNNGKWQGHEADKVIQRGGGRYLTIPADSAGNATIDLVLPGGNCGDYYIYFD